jgi:hypothetical protein
MHERQDWLYRTTFTDAELRALAEANAAPPLAPEAELLRVLIMREQGRERPDAERIGRLVDRLTRLVRAQLSAADGRDPRLDQMFEWLAQIGAERQQAAREEGLRERAALAARVAEDRLASTEASWSTVAEEDWP